MSTPDNLTEAARIPLVQARELDKLDRLVIFTHVQVTTLDTGQCLSILRGSINSSTLYLSRLSPRTLDNLQHWTTSFAYKGCKCTPSTGYRSATAHTQPLIDLLKSCEESGSLKKENCIHRHVLKSDFSDRDLLVLSNHQVHVYFKCNYYEAARRVFDEMPQRNVFSWTVMIVASKEHGYYRDGVELFCMTLDQGVLPNGFAFSAVLQSCVGLVSVELGEMVHTHVVVTVFFICI
ncbi:hypothetical protein JHK87_006906 [Glycine soja]|nr:hypothetical protein JHK87_006906 [Glycine soja]